MSNMWRPLALVLFLAASSVVPIVLDHPIWVNSWGETGRVLEDATALSFPAAAAVAALQARSTLATLSNGCGSDRARFLATVKVGLRCSVLPTSVFLVVAIGAFVTTSFSSADGAVPVIVLLPILAGFSVAVSFGMLLSRGLPGPLAAPLAAATIYGLGYIVDTSNPSLRPLAGLTVSDPRERTSLMTLPWVLVDRALWLLAVAALCLALASGYASASRAALAAASLLATPLLFIGDAVMVPRTITHQSSEPPRFVLVDTAGARSPSASVPTGSLNFASMPHHDPL